MGPRAAVIPARKDPYIWRFRPMGGGRGDVACLAQFRNYHNTVALVTPVSVRSRRFVSGLVQSRPHPRPFGADVVGAFRKPLPSETLLMRMRGPELRNVLLLVVGGVALGLSSPALAQTYLPAGVEIDAQGVVQKKVYADPGGQLTRQRINSARARWPRTWLPSASSARSR